MNPSPYELRPDLPEELAELRILALDLRWSWSHVADRLWRTIDAELWHHTRNPWLILQTVSLRRLNALAGDEHFRQLIQQLREEQVAALTGDSWFERKYPDVSPTTAYFCMEYGLTEALPLYSGGLGVLAGDHLKTASELGVPLVAVGLLYQQGYFRQALGAHGEQLAFYPFNDPSLMPITPVRNAEGEWISIPLELPGRTLRLRPWQAQVGRITLYLLDSNDPLNDPADRGITSELYGGGRELRLQQELVLGIGGYRLLQALGNEPAVCHLNEGHAAFAVLERARLFMVRNRVDFETALMATRAGNLFTTHTPVDAGFDRFDPELVRHYLSPWAEQAGVAIDVLLRLGRSHPRAANGEPFNMAWLGIHASGAVNGVSRLHGDVSRHLFQPLFPRWPTREVPVGHVTNGVHVSSWDSPESDRLWTETCGKERWREEPQAMRENILELADEAIWEMRTRNRQRLIQWIRRRQPGRQIIQTNVEDLLDPNVLTLGFARRFATYKRPNLLLHDAQRLARLLTRIDQPVQLVLAGKAHPRDRDGQTMIREWVEFILRHELQRHVVFLVDYDLLTADHLVEGVDVWINTPRRPWEACGTSGMKVLVNGGLNFSELDGWWAEAWCPHVGWALGDGREHDADPAWDAHEAEELYDKLEHEIIPAFYRRNPVGIPEDWVNMVRQSMAELTPVFSTNRMLREYVESFYLPMAERVTHREQDGARLARELCDWRHRIETHWPAIHFGNVQIRSDEREFHFEAQVYLDDLDPDAVRVELYAEPLPGHTDPERHPLTRREQLAGAVNGWRYDATIPAQRPVGDYTVRIIPWHPEAIVPLECTPILWQH
ncbi:MAG TPA: alpha-glucan family phosphorylase [Gammaproteobacteria bacterium]|nr:alpha-glucan family phosphorylase [Gammaproteobacteria bacterium]